jgi:hypothetical protein
MISHLELSQIKMKASCPLLGGKTFVINQTVGGTPVPGTTVEIANNLSYVVKTPGAPDQSGQLTKVNDSLYKYREAGPPVVKGVLVCFGGVWSFNDKLPNSESGTIEPAGM